VTRFTVSAALVLALSTGPAFALSCIQPDLARTYQQASAAKEVYIIVQGSLSFDEGRLPVVDYNNQENTPHNTYIPARLLGQSLTLNGFDAAFDQSITLNAKCFGPWCANPASGLPYLAFLERTEAGYMLVLDPCGGFGFPEPTEAVKAKAVICFQGGACAPDEQ